jgi:hypothetical protein
MTETEIATPLRVVIDGYFAMWNETDSALRREIIEETWTRDASYVEPLMVAEGHEALNAGVAGLQAQFPGHELRSAGRLDSHHDHVRWSWELFAPGDDTAMAAGTNVGMLAPDGRLRRVTGFFDRTPDAA